MPKEGEDDDDDSRPLIEDDSSRRYSTFHCHEPRRNGSDTPERVAQRRATRVLWISILICLAFMLAEVVGGVYAQSLAIVTDAAHLLTDLASMLISLFSIYLADRPRSQRMSFGWHRAEVLGALVSVLMIWVVTGVLVFLAIQRLIFAEYEIDAPIMAVTAAAGVLVNIIMGAVLFFGGHHGHSHHGHSHHHSHHDDAEDAAEKPSSSSINVRAAFIHVLGDLIQSVAVLIAALLIYINKNWAIADPICTLIFSVIVLCTTLLILRDALVVLLEGRPSSVHFGQVFEALSAVDGVGKVHDLRIWSLTTDKIAISVHLEIKDGVSGEMVLRQTTELLRRRFGVHESTVQIERHDASNQKCDDCAVPGVRRSSLYSPLEGTRAAI